MTTTITVSDELAARLAARARQAGQPLESYLSSVVEAMFGEHVRWEGRRPVLPVAGDATPVTVAQIDDLHARGDTGAESR